MLTLKDYLMGREVLYKDDYTLDIQSNALNLIKRVNNLLTALKINSCTISSGWRPLAVNMRVGGAKRSLHMTGRAVDLMDKDGLLKKTILDHSSLLLDYGLWMEDPHSTPTWCHLDMGIRNDRNPRVFKI